MQNWFAEEHKCNVRLSISDNTREFTFNGSYDDDVEWQHILNELVIAMEAFYGYSFNLEETLGIYHNAKD